MMGEEKVWIVDGGVCVVFCVVNEWMGEERGGGGIVVVVRFRARRW